jgi:hypothetical protein
LKGGQQPLRIPYDELVYSPDPSFHAVDDGPQRRDDEHVHAFYERREAWIEAIRRVVQPEPGTFEPPEEPVHYVDLRKDYGDRGLQIIVKLANIYLTPEKPKYNGGVWHVEGQLVGFLLVAIPYYF